MCTFYLLFSHHVTIITPRGLSSFIVLCTYCSLPGTCSVTRWSIRCVSVVIVLLTIRRDGLVDSLRYKDPYGLLGVPGHGLCSLLLAAVAYRLMLCNSMNVPLFGHSARAQ